MRRVLAFALCGLSLGACASSGGVGDLLPNVDSTAATAPLELRTEPPGAEATTTTNQSCRTPCTLQIASTSDFKVTFRLEGYEPVQTDVRAVAAADPLAIPRVRFDPNPLVMELDALPAPTRRRRPAARRSAPRQPAARPAARKPAPAPAARRTAPAPAAAPAQPAPPPAAAPAPSPWPPAPGQQQ